MNYKDVDNFYSASYHAGIILRDAGIATHDTSEKDSYSGWVITLDTMADENQHKNIAMYEASSTPGFSQDETIWPREDITILIYVRASGYLSAYTRAHKLCRSIDNGYRSFFNMWDDQLSIYTGWQVKYEYGGLYREVGPQGIERDEKWRPRFQIEYRCNRRIKEITSN